MVYEGVCVCVCAPLHLFLYILAQLSRWVMVGDGGRRGSDGEGVNKQVMEGRMSGGEARGSIRGMGAREGEDGAMGGVEEQTSEEGKRTERGVRGGEAR